MAAATEPQHWTDFESWSSEVMLMPLRVPPIASISSMKPIAPPSAIAILRSVLKYAADLAGRRAVVHRLERRTGDEQEGHSRFRRHRFGGVGLARARQALEEQAAARCAAHVVAENALCARNRLIERMTSSFTVSMPTTSLIRTLICSGR